MRPARATRWPGCAAVPGALALVLGGCGVTLADGVSRAQGVSQGGHYGDRGSRDEVPVRGHHVRVARRGDDPPVAGELIAADERDLVIERWPGNRVRIPLADVEKVQIRLAPAHAGTTALVTIGAMAVGLVGLVTLEENSSVSAFFAGWGVVWLPLGLLVALPAAAIVAASGDGTVEARPSQHDRLVRNLYQFARYPQGDPEAPPKPVPPVDPAQPPAAPTPAEPPVSPPAPENVTPPRPIEPFPSVAPPPAGTPPPAPARTRPAPVPPRDDSEDTPEPSVVPYSPSRPQAPPTR
jgi:hypothetical protein